MCCVLVQVWPKEQVDEIIDAILGMLDENKWSQHKGAWKQVEAWRRSRM